STLAWAREDENILYLTVQRQDAQNYATEAAIGDMYAKYGDDFMDEDGNEKPAPSKAIIVTFDLAQLQALEGVQFQPDWGWHGADENTSWQQSLAAVGSFCIAGFTPAHKAL